MTHCSSNILSNTLATHHHLWKAWHWLSTMPWLSAAVWMLLLGIYLITTISWILSVCSQVRLLPGLPQFVERKGYLSLTTNFLPPCFAEILIRWKSSWRAKQGQWQVAEYAVEFRTLDAESGRKKTTLKAVFRQGLNMDILIELACWDNEANW